MNTDLNDYIDDYYEKYSICEIDKENIEISDDDEALQKHRINQFIKNIPIYGNTPIYIPHPTKKQLYSREN